MSDLAHIKDDGTKHRLEKHLEKVAGLAEEFASSFGHGDWTKLAGLWHDLGKYNPAFQKYLCAVTEGDKEDAHLEDVEKIRQTRGPDHSTAGAEHAMSRFHEVGKHKAGRILAYMIAGHHAGLADWRSGDAMAQGTLGVRLNERGKQCLQQVLNRVPQTILDAPLPSSLPAKDADRSLWIRMMFSCLVDADFLDTENFMNADVASARGQHPSLRIMHDQYRLYMQKMKAGLRAPDSAINKIRADILDACLQKAAQPPGLFTLDVPTGGGKTLASLGFALDHALAHNKHRIIYAIPYTSIIEQTANIFGGIFGTENVIEHHSQYDAEKAGIEHSRQRLATENWDASLIVTTNVQFFESLHAARTSRVRKLHNIANSVIILDEAQLLPPEFLDPIRHVMDQLMRHYGVTFVLSTATLPVLDNPPIKPGAVQKIRFERCTPIIDEPDQLHRRLRRVEVSVRKEPVNRWEEIVPELSAHENLLCIVNRRDDCRQLHALMPYGAIHLSALMCGAHRSEVIASIRAKLAHRSVEPLRVISTQLVEAGVDLDFDVVYRAMAGFDSIAQAAGRCNREGRRAMGQVIVFTPPKEAPMGLLRRAEEAGKTILRHPAEGDLLQPENYRRYFQEFYGGMREHYDKHEILSLLRNNSDLEFSFRTAAERFRMIDDVYRPVITAYGEGAALIAALRCGVLNRSVLRKAQRYSVSIPQNQHQVLLRDGAIQELSAGIFVQSIPSLYDPVLGLMLDTAMNYGAMDLVC